MSLWAVMAAPLIAGNDLTTMSSTVQSILTNSEVIAVDQDPLGQGGWRVRDQGDLEVWMRPLNGTTPTRAIAYVNRGSSTALITVSANEVQLASFNSPVRDMWSHTDLTWVVPGSTSLAMTVQPHDVVFVKATGPIASPLMYEAESPANTRIGSNIDLQSCSNCSGYLKIGHVGYGNTLKFNRINKQTAGATTVQFYYLTDSLRTATIKVNGTTAGTYNFGSTGGFNTVGQFNISLNLAAGLNTIEISNASGWAPDFDKIKAYNN